MSDDAFTAFRVGDALRGQLEGPWEVFGERGRRYEVHLTGTATEMERGPLSIEGFGLRVFRPQGDEFGVGFVATTDLSERAIARAAEDAVATSSFARFPTRRVELPATRNGAAPSVETVDPNLWDHPVDALHEYAHALLTPFEGRTGVVPSFGSVRAALSEFTLTNSEGIQRRMRRTSVELEFAVKAFGGPEGRAPGEYWVNAETCQLSTRGLADAVAGWCQRAQDVRIAQPTPAGIKNVVLPPSALADIVPPILGFRLSGAAELRKMAPAPGDAIGAPSLTLADDGLLPYGLESAPYDDEGNPQVRRVLIDRGVVGTPALDLLHAGAFQRSPTGSGKRGGAVPSWFRFTGRPSPAPTTLVVTPGDGGSEAELMESAEDGLYLDQLGFPFPDSLSGAFGGEIRIGYRIRHGKKGEPVRGGTLGGVAIAAPGEPSLIHSIRGIGSAAELRGGLSTPALWVDGLTVAGEG